jgi:hypothetical protein
LSTSVHTHLSTGAGTIGQLVAGIPCGLSLAQPHETKKNLIKKEAIREKLKRIAMLKINDIILALRAD